jgi:DNA-binding MarR family transcriptional regulator
MKESYIQQFRRVLRIFDQELFLQNHASCCDGISLSQCLTLLEIERNREISVSELAQKLSLDKSTVSRTVDGLVNIELVNRIIPRENRRMALIHLTDSGKKVCSKINYSNDSYVSEILQDFSEEERDQLLMLFRKLAGNMKTFRLRSENKEAIP